MFCVVLLSFKRPQNIAKITRILLSLNRVGKLIICNNNPKIDLKDWGLAPTWEDSRVHLIQQTEEKDCAIRFDIARQYSTDFEHFMCPDDDLFLKAHQYERIMDAYASNPSEVHGVRGQILTHGKSGPRLNSGLSGRNSRLDILNCLYVFSRKHLERYHAHVNELVWDSAHLRFVDDILISASSLTKPICVDVGDLEFCDTQDATEIATWRQKGFYERRIQAYFQVMKHKVEEREKEPRTI